MLALTPLAYLLANPFDYKFIIPNVTVHLQWFTPCIMTFL